MALPLPELWRLSATEAVARLKNGDMKVEEYVRALLDRIQTRDATVQAWPWLDPSQTLEQARRLDSLPAADDRGTLFGLPVGIKDVILTKDMPTQYNSRLFQSSAPIGLDANPVLTLRGSGALVLGKTSTTEFATSKQGDWHQNRTANPHDPRRTPGGSSSGSAAAVADFHAPVALGTQTGGSIVRPASYNGCYGFKPTWGAVSREGLAQWCPTLDTCGFFARSVADVELLADAFMICDDDAVPAEEESGLAGAKIAFCETANWPKAGPGLVGAMEKAREILRRHGAVIEDLRLPGDFDHVLRWHAAVLAGEGRSSFLGQYLTDKTKLHADIVGHVENKNGVSRKDLLDAYDNCARLRGVWDALASEYAVVLTPSVPDEAPLGLENTGDMSFCSTWTIMHAPALNIPGFAGANGLPIGLTAVAPRYRDRHLLRVARAIGAVFEAEGGWQRANA